jgi:hypothetical protein
MAQVTHNAPFLTTLPHTRQQKSVAKRKVYWKVIHNLETMAAPRKIFPAAA